MLKMIKVLNILIVGSLSTLPTSMGQRAIRLMPTQPASQMVSGEGNSSCHFLTLCPG